MSEASCKPTPSAQKLQFLLDPTFWKMSGMSQGGPPRVSKHKTHLGWGTFLKHTVGVGWGPSRKPGVCCFFVRSVFLLVGCFVYVVFASCCTSCLLLLLLLFVGVLVVCSCLGKTCWARGDVCLSSYSFCFCCLLCFYIFCCVHVFPFLCCFIWVQYFGPGTVCWSNMGPEKEEDTNIKERVKQVLRWTWFVVGWEGNVHDPNEFYCI